MVGVLLKYFILLGFFALLGAVFLIVDAFLKCKAAKKNPEQAN